MYGFLIMFIFCNLLFIIEIIFAPFSRNVYVCILNCRGNISKSVCEYIVFVCVAINLNKQKAQYGLNQIKENNRWRNKGETKIIIIIKNKDDHIHK